ncbi:MAG: RDD family protein [Pirellulales bacterium]|nr:RDD family protein [Pirellulales bacterium]
MPDENPFQSPFATSASDPVVATEVLQLATRLQRLLNLMVDVFCYIGFSCFLTATVAILGGEAAIRALQELPNLIYVILLYFAYYVPQETLTGRTLAKFLTRTKVVTTDGKPAIFPRIVGRTLCRMIPFEFVSYLVGGRWPVGLHDKFSGTCVVSTR